MGRVYLLAFQLVALACFTTVYTDETTTTVGGYVPIKYGEVDYDLAVTTARLSFEQLKLSDPELKGVEFCKVETVERQIVAGINYRVTAILGIPNGDNTPCTPKKLYYSVVDKNLHNDFVIIPQHPAYVSIDRRL